MALRVAVVKKVRWPVTVNVPKDGGQVDAETFEAEFNVLKQSELEGLKGDMLAAVLAGWPDDKGPKHENGTDRVPFTAEAKAELLDAPHARTGLFNAYAEIQTGRAAARKN